MSAGSITSALVPSNSMLRIIQVGGRDGRERFKAEIVTGGRSNCRRVQGTVSYLGVLKSDSQFPGGLDSLFKDKYAEVFASGVQDRVDWNVPNNPRRV